MRLAIVSSNLSYPWGGAEKPWTHLAEYAIAEGHQVLAVLAPQVAQHPRIQSLVTNGARVHERTRFSSRRSRLDGLRHYFNATARWAPLCAALNSFRPDLVLLNQGGVFDFLLEDQLLEWCRARRVGMTIYCHCNSEHWPLSPADRARAQALLPTMRAVFFVSTHNRLVAERQLAAKVPRATVVQSPVDATLLASSIAWPAVAGIACAVVSRVDAHHKGLDLLVPALAEAWGEHRDWTVNLYGDGPDREYVATLAAQHGLAERIRFHGFVSDLKALWSANQLLLLPSRHEGCSLSMLEAMACQRGVLATDVGGVSDWLVDDRNSFVCPAASVPLLAAVLRRAREQQHRWRPLGLAASETFKGRRDPHPEGTLLQHLLDAARG